ncbi:MAG: DUF2470 domain-containing protein [Bacteroidota bacterium]
MENNAFPPKFVTMAINHMNDDHRKDMVTMLHALANATWVEDAEMLAFGIEKTSLRAFGPDGRTEDIDLAYPHPIAKAQEFRPVLVDMVRKARKVLAENPPTK